MSNQLSVFGQLPFSPAATSIAAPASEVPSFFPRIQLYTKGSAIDQGLIRPGHYGIPDGEAVIDLGPAIDVVPLAVLEKALDVSNRDKIVTVFGEDKPEFARIKADSEVADSGCMYGPVFLVLERTTGKFYELFANSKSSRRELEKLKNYLPVNDTAAAQLGIEARNAAPANLSAKFVKKPRYSWHAPVACPSNASFTKIPDLKVVIESIQQFLDQANPKTAESSDR
jgi:hypothetical protein